MNKEEYSKEEYEKILKELKDTEEMKRELEEKIKPLRDHRKKELKDDIEKMLSDEGFTLEDILNTSPDKNKKSNRKSTSNANYPTYVLKDNPEIKYTRGTPSEDIKKKMVECGYDPTEKGSFKQFKEKYMTKKPEETPQDTSQEDA